MKDLEDKVFNFNTKYDKGFLSDEISLLLKDYPNINMDKFYDALNGNTCAVIDNQMISYHHDILKALICGIENRNLYIGEWD